MPPSSGHTTLIKFSPCVPIVFPASIITEQLCFPILVNPLSVIDWTVLLFIESFNICSAAPLEFPKNLAPLPLVVDKCFGLTYASSILNLSTTFLPCLKISSATPAPLPTSSVPYAVILNPHNKKANHVNLIKLLLFLLLSAIHMPFYISSCHIQYLQAFS